MKDRRNSGCNYCVELLPLSSVVNELPKKFFNIDNILLHFVKYNIRKGQNIT